MNESKYKIHIADLLLSVSCQTASLGVVYSFPQSLDSYNHTHIHPTYEIFFVSSGTLNVFTPTKRLECLNSIVIIPPGLSHCTATYESKISVMNFKISQAQGSGASPLFSRLSDALADEITVLPIDERIAFYLKSIQEMKADSFLSKEGLPHLISLLFADIFSRIAPTSNAAVTEKHQNYVKAIEEYLTYHYNEKLLVSDFAKLLYLSPKQIARIIRKEYDCTFSEMITAHRLGIACMLLVRTDIEVNEIASSVGYEYPANFHVHFKKAYGMTPAEYRRQAHMTTHDKSKGVSK